jgi:RHH-type rel operon transcriptional repressor/antitoxin RelB
MSSARLPVTLEERLERMAESTGTSKSRIIRDALERYLEEYECRRTPFDLGRDLFGPAGSGRKDLSTAYKRLLKEKLREKHPG